MNTPSAIPPQGRPPDTGAVFLVCALLVLCLGGVYGGVGGHDFINYDDPLYITDNPAVRSGLTLEGARWALTATHASNWHPLTWLSHMLDVELFGLHPGGHHLVSLLLHTCNTLLLFAAFRALTGDLWPSALVAALFALHPLHVESVAWAAERKDTLSTLFGFAALWRYARYTAEPAHGSYWPVWIYFALSLAAKPMLVTLPFVFLLLDFWPLGRCREGLLSAIRLPGVRWAPAVLAGEKLPFFLLSAVSAVITVVVQHSGQAMMNLVSLPVGVRLTHCLVAYMAYIGKTLWPSSLAVLYPHPGPSPVWKIWAAGAVLAVISAAVLRWRRRYPYLLVGWLWFVSTLVPVIGLVQVGVQGMADRYTYVPLIGLFVMVAWGGRQVFAHFCARPLVPAALSVLLIGGLMAASRLQVGRWTDNLTLYAHTLAVTTDNYPIHNNMGVALAAGGRIDEAMAHFSAALRIKPGYESAVNNLAGALAARNQPEEATALYRRSLALMPRSAEAHNNLAVVLEQQGQTAEATAHFAEALAIHPDYDKAHYNLGRLLALQGRPEAAIAHFRAAIRINPFFADAHNNLGVELAGQGRLHDAAAHYRKALQWKPDFPEALNNLGIALVGQGRFPEARRRFEAALALDPDFEPARENLERLRQMASGKR